MKKQKPKLFRYKTLVLLLFIISAVALILSLYKYKQSEKVVVHVPYFQKQGEVTFYTSENKPLVTIDVEIADTDEKRELGLMGRPTLGEKEGMLFIFEREHLASFWMKNTMIPLDMVFINAQGVIVTIHENTTPFSEQSYTATAPTQYVVEVNAGFTSRHSIRVGDKVTWQRFLH
ncbi:MAG: DUF192 domain-containing protein [Bacteroidetes bacterium]|nr:DUF192 domain-containing protein [Bacteroidota bacterium]